MESEQSSKTVRIYVLKCPISGEVRYVGKTIKPLGVRLSNHISDKRKTHRRSWIESLSRKGMTPTIESVDEFLDCDADWQERERYWIDAYRKRGARLLNHTDGGEGLHNPDEATRAKLSQNARGHIKSAEVRERHRQFMLKFRHTEETKKKISDQKKGVSQNLTDEQRLARSLAMRGRKHTPEARAKISAAGIGRTKSPETIAKLKNPAIVRVTPESTMKMRETKRKLAQDPEWRSAQAKSLGVYAEKVATESQIEEARRLRANGLSYQAIGNAVGVTYGTARRACLGIGAYANC